MHTLKVNMGLFRLCVWEENAKGWHRLGTLTLSKSQGANITVFLDASQFFPQPNLPGNEARTTLGHLEDDKQPMPKVANGQSNLSTDSPSGQAQKDLAFGASPACVVKMQGTLFSGFIK